jgi:hypothetical protein
MKKYVGAKGTVQYLNSGDWIENLTCLEYTDEWKLVYFKDLNISEVKEEETIIRKLSPDIIDMQIAFDRHRGAAMVKPTIVNEIRIA